MIYRIVAVYLPDHPRICGQYRPEGTALLYKRYRRGAWRVLRCCPLMEGATLVKASSYLPNAIRTISDRPYRKGALFNPAAALRRALAARRNNGKAAA